TPHRETNRHRCSLPVSLGLYVERMVPLQGAPEPHAEKVQTSCHSAVGWGVQAPVRQVIEVRDDAHSDEASARASEAVAGDRRTKAQPTALRRASRERAITVS